MRAALLADIERVGATFLRRCEAEQKEREKKRARRAFLRRRAGRLIVKVVRAWLHATPRVCMICSDKVLWTSMTPFGRCHRACSPCAREYVDHALNEGRLHVRCPGILCKALLGDGRLEQIASSEAIIKRDENRRAANARRLQSFTKEPSEEDAAFFSFAQEHTRKCPQCHVLIYRSAGCNHMVCKCGVRRHQSNSRQHQHY